MSNSPIDDILKRLQKLQSELEEEIDSLLQEKRQEFRYHLSKGKVKFEQGMKRLQRRHKLNTWKYLVNARIGHILTAPFIYMVIVPFLLLDMLVSIYQHICFRVYGIPRVSRKDFIIIDRQQLAYLNLIEKINCMYCGYANGLIEFVREVSARTEQYWCPIKHARRSPDPHRLVAQFVDYGDAESYKKKLQLIQQDIATLRNRQSREVDDDMKS